MTVIQLGENTGNLRLQQKIDELNVQLARNSTENAKLREDLQKERNEKAKAKAKEIIDNKYDCCFLWINCLFLLGICIYFLIMYHQNPDVYLTSIVDLIIITLFSVRSTDKLRKNSQIEVNKV